MSQPIKGILIICFLTFSVQAQFTRITTGDIVNDGGTDLGESWVDYDNDNIVDLFVNGSGNRLYRNNGDGTFLRIIDTSSICSYTVISSTWGDFNNDGLQDFYGTHFIFKNLFCINNGNGMFTKVIDGTIVIDPINAIGCSWVDYNNDGFLDIFVTGNGGSNTHNSLHKNLGNGLFEKITNGSIVNDGGFSNSTNWCDYDNDGNVDLFVANYNAENDFLYHNNGDETFTRIFDSPIAHDSAYSVGGCWGDYDNDGDFDLFVSNGNSENNCLYKNDGSFIRITQGIIVNDGGDSRGCSWGDYDNDSDLDLIVSNNGSTEKNFLYSNNGDGTFSKILSGPVANDTASSQGCSWCDYDNDGDLDLYITNYGQNNFLYNNNGNANHWVKIKCNSVQSNKSAIGTKIRLRAQINGNTVWQLRQIAGSVGRTSQESAIVHFGLGDASNIDKMILEWPSGIIQILENQPVNQLIEVTEAEDNPIQPNFTLQTNGPIEAGVSSVDDNTFYVPSSADKVYRLDSLGLIFYTLNVNGDIKSSTSIAKDQTVYIASTDYNLYSFNANGVTNPNWPVALGAQAIASVAIDDSGNTYIGTDNNVFQVLSPEGSVLWSFNIAAPVYASAAISTNNTLYIVNYNGRLYAFDLDPVNPSNIQYKWHYETFELVTSSPALDDQNNIYITTLNGNLFKIHDNGTAPVLDWTYQAGDGIESSPILGQDYTIYFGCNNGNVYAIDNISGKSLWIYPAFGAVKSTGALVENGLFNRMYIGTSNNMLHCISLIDGSEIWIYVTSSSIECPILFQNGRIYFGTMDGKVISLTDPAYNKIKESSFVSNNVWNTFQGNNFRTGNQADIASKLESYDHKFPESFSLKQNYPNPFNPNTTIVFDLPKTIEVSLKVFNILGQEVATLISGRLSAGSYSYEWDASNLTSGVYLYRLQAGDYVNTRKMVLMR
jgi:outer membrane protein assembly factor BamB